MKDPAILVKNRNQLKDEMVDEYGYIFCQECQKNRCGFKFEWHHLIYRGEEPDHPNLHDKKNLVLLGTNCHNKFHKNKSMRNKWVIRRGLNKLFGKNCIINNK